MRIGALWRRLTGRERPSDTLVVQLHSDDEMDLSAALLRADSDLKASLGLDGPNFLRVHRALNEHSMREFRNGRVVDDAMVSVRLSKEDWKAVFAFCLIAKDQVPGKWPIRVIGRIAAETATVLPKR